MVSASGSLGVQDNRLTLRADALPPGVLGLFYFGPGTVQFPFGDGTRCVGGATLRLPIIGADAAGTMSFNFDLTTPGAGAAIQPFTSFNFQCWYRDSQGPGGTGFNLSDAIGISFRNADNAYDGAQLLGPAQFSPTGFFFPPGIFRGGDAPNPWCAAFLDFDPDVNLAEPRTPGAPNGLCP